MRSPLNGCGYDCKLYIIILSGQKRGRRLVWLGSKVAWQLTFRSYLDYLKYNINRGSQSLHNLVAISQRYCQPLLTIKVGCIGSNGKNWLLNPESSSQSEGYSSKWLIWLVVREPLTKFFVLLLLSMTPQSIGLKLLKAALE